jgi:hypothetical protein
MVTISLSLGSSLDETVQKDFMRIPGREFSPLDAV